MLTRNLDSHHAPISKLNNQILRTATLLLSERTSTSAQQETKRAKQDSANNGTPSNAPTTNPLYIIGGRLDRRRHNIGGIEALLACARPIKRLIHNTPV